MIIVPIMLDPANPALDHHRPGGLPLFGTAMGIGTIFDTARAAFGGDVIMLIEDIRVHTACILRTAEAHQVHISLTPRISDERGRFSDVRLFTPATHDAPEILHFEARVRWDTQSSLPVRGAAPPHAAESVIDTEIYSAFFHGPSFQVVGSAALVGNRLNSTLSEQPMLSNLTFVTRLIEFAMQSAGLLELATTGRMMVPHRIAKIILPTKALKSATAVTTRSLMNEADVASRSDISIFDYEATEIMTLTGYETVPLPFEADDVQIRSLAARLLALRSRAPDLT